MKPLLLLFASAVVVPPLLATNPISACLLKFNVNEKLPAGRKGGLWNPFTIRHNGWWACVTPQPSASN